jgi:hypothetical protein
MTQIPNPVESLWDDLLSSEPDLIRAAYASLDAATQRAVIAHLQRMRDEEDWHPLQQASARAALAVLEAPEKPSTGNPVR